MKITLDQIKMEAKELAEKRSWVRKNADELLKKMNAMMKEINSDYCIDVEMNLDIADEEEYTEDVYLIFDTKTSGEFFFDTKKSYETGWTGRTSFNWFTTKNIRILVNELPRALEKIIKEIRTLDKKYHGTIEQLQVVLDNFQSTQEHTKIV